jgi:predicted NACHT family NTPase
LAGVSEKSCYDGKKIVRVKTMSRSLRVAPEHINKVKLALRQNRFHSQQALATKMGICRTTINSFFNGRPVDFQYFLEICEKLGLDWEAIAYPEGNLAVETKQSSQSQEQSEPQNSIDIDVLVQEVREKVKPTIQEWCSTMKVLDMTQPIKVSDIYTKVNILEKLTARNNTAIEELEQNVDPNESFDRLGIRKILVPHADALETVNTHRKLMVWGKPGAGKTTFLKHLATQCVDGYIQIQRVPLYIQFEEFVIEGSQNFQKTINQILGNCEVTASQTNELLKAGRMFILIDGLDEVKEEDSHLAIKHLKNFLNNFHKNQYVITCRLAGQKFCPDNFTEVEVADFDKQQITQLVSKWFDRPQKTDKFLKKLYSPNSASIQELANNPLLLTLMCLVFNDTAELSSNRFDLYRTAIDILLQKWDVSREKERRKVYKKLSASGRRDLLTYVAYETFKNGQYFFTLDSLTEYIADYIRSSPNTDPERESLLRDSEEIVESIESQHGLFVKRAAPNIYSFSHLTFHEYFTARQITFPPSPPEYEAALRDLLTHLTDPRWREVFLRVTERMSNADYLIDLMKKNIDEMMVKDAQLQAFLEWVYQKSLSFHLEYKQAAIRAFYINIDMEIDGERRLGWWIDFSCTCIFTCASFVARALKSDITPSLLDKVLEPASSLANNPDLDRDNAIAQERVLALRILESEYWEQIDPDMKEKLQTLKESLPQLDEEHQSLNEWEKTHRHNWVAQVKVLIVAGQEISEGHWQTFNEDKQHLLKQYYEANLLLLDCMKEAYISPEKRQEIEETLLLPIAEIERLQRLRCIN